MKKKKVPDWEDYESSHSAAIDADRVVSPLTPRPSGMEEGGRDRKLTGSASACRNSCVLFPAL